MSDTFTDTDVAIAEETATFVPPAEGADAAFELILLDPAKVKLFRTGGSTVRATITDPILGAERTYLRVQTGRAFPFSQPDRYIGLRDDKDKDIGMMPNLKGLDAESRRIVDEELERRYFIPRIEKVNSVKEEFGTTTWEVETNRGPRRFLVQRLRDSVQSIGPTRMLIIDKDGTRYEFPDTDKLDVASRTVLQRVLQ
jgi:hypothetical protein